MVFRFTWGAKKRFQPGTCTDSCQQPESVEGTWNAPRGLGLQSVSTDCLEHWLKGSVAGTTKVNLQTSSKWHLVMSLI